jgi:hypothetical protein
MTGTDTGATNLVEMTIATRWHIDVLLAPKVTDAEFGRG